MRAQVSAPTGLKARLPISLVQMASRMRAVIGASSPAAASAAAMPRALRQAAVGFSQDKAPAHAMFDYPGFDHLGRGVHHAAENAAAIETAQHGSTWIDAAGRLAVESPALLVKIPPRDAVDGRYHRCLFAQEWLEARQHLGDAVGLERNEYRVLLAQAGEVIGRMYRQGERFPLRAQREALGAHR